MARRAGMLGGELMNILKLVAVWYFDIGWIIASMAGLLIGLTFKWKLIIGWVIFMLALGTFLLAVKNA